MSNVPVKNKHLFFEVVEIAWKSWDFSFNENRESGMLMAEQNVL